MENELTNKEFWKNYWFNYQYKNIPSKVIYCRYLPRLKNKRNFLEIGGFPGINAAYFYIHGCTDVTILDFYIDPQIVHQFEEYNQMPEGAIQCIEADFFNIKSNRKYDIVFSSGFIEHFEDTQDVIKRHVDLLSEQGTILIILPNFRGLNGFLQYVADRKNYKAHNLASMHIKTLRKIMNELGFPKAEISYTRKPMLWLEPKAGKRHKLAKLMVKILSHALKLLPFKCRLLSPYIIIFAENTNV